LDYLRKQEDTGSCRRMLRIALFGELSLEEAVDLSQDRLLLQVELEFSKMAGRGLGFVSRQEQGFPGRLSVQYHTGMLNTELLISYSCPDFVKYTKISFRVL
jgi:hypothetical protein